MKKTLFILTVLALGFTACNKEIEQPKEENQEVEIPEEQTPEETPTVYNVCIPASMGADTKAVDFSGTDPVTGKPTAVSSFTTSDIIYVYNQDKGAMLTGHLSPSAAGKTCDLTGTLTGTIEKNDILVLLYKLNFFNSERNVYCYDYSEQNGTQADVLDGATATVTASVDDDNLTAASASFTNVQSMFRFQFASGGTPVNVKSVLITSKNNALSIVYYPLIAADPYFLSFSAPVSLPSATTDPIYVALCMDESISAGDELTFGVVDADNKYYTKTKAAPSGGFKNGRYYYNSAPIGLDYVAQLVKPTLSRSDDGDVSELADAAADRCFYIYSPLRSGVGTADGISMSISGTSTGYSFGLSSYADDAAHAVNISGLTATFAGVAVDDSFINSSDNLTLNISGENTIVCRNSRFCVDSYNVLKLSGYGTLTVTSNYAAGYGIGGSNYNPIASSNPSVLAADGHTATRSATTDNGDGTYTWTYTVYPTPPAGALSGKFTVNGSGKQVFFSQGNLVYNGGGTWSFHENQYDWFSGSSTATGYPMDLFTWGNISSPAFNGDSYDTGTAALSGSRDWGSNMADGWRTLTKAEWEYLFNTRTSGVRFARGTVNGVTGMILLPDSWSTSYYTLNKTNKNKSEFTSNVISSTVWADNLEAHGAVFLPAAGSRTGYGLDITAQQGSYWSSSSDGSSTDAFCVGFDVYSVLFEPCVSRQVGRSVRLVYDVE